MDYLVQSRDCQFKPPNQSSPTQARPGSAQKLQVMAERFRSGQPLHHPDDVTSVGNAMSAFLAWARQKDNADETGEQEHQLLTLRSSVGNGSWIEFTGGH
jgi:hypothetical protein